jgi:hypothetical protein
VVHENKKKNFNLEEKKGSKLVYTEKKTKKKKTKKK